MSSIVNAPTSVGGGGIEYTELANKDATASYYSPSVVFNIATDIPNFYSYKKKMALLSVYNVTSTTPSFMGRFIFYFDDGLLNIIKNMDGNEIRKGGNTPSVIMKFNGSTLTFTYNNSSGGSGNAKMYVTVYGIG